MTEARGLAPSLFLHCRLDPVAVVPDELNERIDRFRFGYIALHYVPFLVKGNDPRPCADISVIRIGHFPWAIDDATHDADFHPFQMGRYGSDFCRCFLEVKQGASTARTADVFCFRDARSGSLQYAEGG